MKAFLFDGVGHHSELRPSPQIRVTNLLTGYIYGSEIDVIRANDGLATRPRHALRLLAEARILEDLAGPFVSSDGPPLALS